MDWQVGIDLRLDGDDAILEVSGDLDLDTSEGLRSVLRTAVRDSSQRVIVDVTDVRHADSSGIRVMAQFARLLREEGRGLQVRGAPPRLMRALQILGLYHLLGPEAAPPVEAAEAIA